MRRAGTATTVFLLVNLSMPAHTSAQEERFPVDVYVTGRKGVQALAPADRKAAEADLRNRASAAGAVVKDLERALKAKYGNNRDRWPADQRLAWEKTQADRREADLIFEHLRNTQQDVDDTVEDIRKALTGSGPMTQKKAVRLVESQEAAELVVEVLGRRSDRSGYQPRPGWVDNAFFLYLRLSPGPRGDAGRFQRIRHPWGGSAREIRGPAAGEPFWAIEIQGDLRWLIAADQAASALNEFVKMHYDALTARRTSTPRP